MAKPTRDVTAAELAILEHLWSTGSTTVKDLAENLYGASTASEVATVQKLLTRLESKGFVERDRESWPHKFAAALQRQELISQRLQATAEELCDGTLGGLLTHLVKSKSFNARQRKKLRKLLDELDE